MKKLIFFLFFLPSLAFAQLELPYGIKVLNPRPLDALYYESDNTPYDSEAEVIAAIPAALRYAGLKVNILGVDYVFTGTGDEDLEVYLPFWKTSGTTTLTGSTVVTGSSIAFESSVEFNSNPSIRRYGSVPTFEIYRGNGTKESPTGVLSGGSMQIRFGGYNGSAFSYGALINAFANQSWSSSAMGMDMSFTVKEANTTTDVANFHILGTAGNAGSVVIGPYGAANARLHIRKNNNYPSVNLFAISDQGNSNLFFTVDSTGTAILSKDARYIGDLSGTFTDSSLVTKAFVLSAIDTLSSGGSTNSTSLRNVPLDESVESPSDGDILVYRSDGNDWVLEPISTGGGITNSASSSQVMISDGTNATGDADLTWNGSNNTLTVDGLRLNGIGNKNLFLGTGAGNLSVGVGLENVGIGDNTLAAITTANRNTALGYNALPVLVSGFNNVAVGNAALLVNTGSANTAIGKSAMESNTSGSSNVALGSNALKGNVTGASSTAVGTNALTASTFGGNAAFGAQSGATLTTGSLNTLIGTNAMATGYATNSNSVGVGYNSLYHVKGVRNIGIGVESMSNTKGDDNIAIGNSAADFMIYTTANNQNVIIGSGAMAGSAADSTSGSNNVIVGHASLPFVDGSDNIAIGSTITGLASGSNNIFIGKGITSQSSTQSNTLSIQNIIFGTGNSGTGTTISTGNIGIGTASPASKLEVAGTVTAQGVTVSTSATLPSATTIGSVDATEIGYVNGVTSAIQTQLNSKTTTALTASTGSSIAFDIPRRYGTTASPITGNITYNSTGAVVGQVQTMIHNDSSEPTWGSEFDIISGTYTTSTNNKIMLFLVESGVVWVTISQ